MPKINLNLTIEAGFLTENLVNLSGIKKLGLFKENLITTYGTSISAYFRFWTFPLDFRRYRTISDPSVRVQTAPCNFKHPCPILDVFVGSCTLRCWTLLCNIE